MANKPAPKKQPVQGAGDWPDWLKNAIASAGQSQAVRNVAVNTNNAIAGFNRSTAPIRNIADILERLTAQSNNVSVNNPYGTGQPIDRGIRNLGTVNTNNQSVNDFVDVLRRMFLQQK